MYGIIYTSLDTNLIDFHIYSDSSSLNEYSEPNESTSDIDF